MLDSIIVTSILGFSIASKIPGQPLPEPTSIIFLTFKNSKFMFAIDNKVSSIKTSFISLIVFNPVKLNFLFHSKIKLAYFLTINFYCCPFLLFFLDENLTK